MSCITVCRLKILEGVSVFTWICTKLICGLYLSLYMVITGNYVYIIYKPFSEKVKYYIHYFYFIYIFKYSLSQACLNVWKESNVQKVEWTDSRYFNMQNILPYLLAKQNQLKLQSCGLKKLLCLPFKNVSINF